MSYARIAGMAATFAAVAALAACQAMPQTRPIATGPTSRPAPVAPSAIDGEWLSSDGVSLSRFSGNRFETVALDSGNRLAEGSFTMRDQSTIALDMTSLIRNTNVQVNCLRVSDFQLNCTSATGAQFSLTRRSSGFS